jgi:hypothetical protein
MALRQQTPENNFYFSVFNLIMERLVSILLSFALLASHINLTIGTHFCGGEAVLSRIMIGHEQLSCGMANIVEPCDESRNHQDSGFTNPPCCANHYQTFKATDDFVKDAAKIKLYFDFIAAWGSSIINADTNSQSAKHFYADYAPPPLKKNLHVFFQTFIL